MRRPPAVVIALIMAFVATLAATAVASSAATATTTTRVNSAGISIASPERWTVVPVTKKGVASMSKAAEKNNPKLAALLSTAS
jgi:hypothetical protein